MPNPGRRYAQARLRPSSGWRRADPPGGAQSRTRAPVRARGTGLARRFGVPREAVLVVDPDALVRWALERELGLRAISVHTAATRAEAQAEIAKRSYRIAFVDSRLPDGDGLQLLREIREASPSTCVVVLGCDASAESKVRAFAGGACQFLDKPFEISEIASIVSSRLDGHAERRAHERYICRLPLRLSLDEPSPESAGLDLRNLGGTSVDVSTGGLRVRTVFPMRPGQAVRIELLLTDDPCARHVRPRGTARVVWVSASEAGVTAGLRYVGGSTPDRTS